MIIEWLESQFRRTRKPKAGLARALKVDKSGITRLMLGERELKATEVATVERYSGAPMPVFASEVHDILHNKSGEAVQDGLSKLEGVTLPPELDMKVEEGEQGMAHPSIVEVLNEILNELRDNREAIKALSDRLPDPKKEAVSVVDDDAKNKTVKH